VFCFLEYQSIGVLLKKCRTPVTDLPLRTTYIKFASTNTNVVVRTGFPRAKGRFFGNSSHVSAYGVFDQSCTRKSKSDTSGVCDTYYHCFKDVVVVFFYASLSLFSTSHHKLCSSCRSSYSQLRYPLQVWHL
jgi:hypothetical protein